jgi:hypothetical protein
VFVDGQAALQLLAALLVLANTLVNVWTNRKVAAVDSKVNGLATQAIAGAKLEGLVQGAGITVPPPLAPPPSTP